MTTYIYLPPTDGSGSLYWEDPVANAAALPVSDNTGAVRLALDTGALYWFNGATWVLIVSPTADVQGPASSTDEALVRFNGTTGKLLQNSVAILSDVGNLSGVGTLGLSGPITDASQTADRAVVTNGSKAMISSATTATEIGYVSGVTSAIQTQINTKVTGPASATDEAVVRYDSTTGKLVQNSGVTIDDSANLQTTARINAGTAKVGATGAVTTSATLEVAGTAGAFLLPRLNDTQRDALTPAGGMMIYNTTNDRPQVYVAGSTNDWVDAVGWGNPT